MTLRELMDRAVDETWFCVVTPDGEEHFFWNADYVGWHPDVMPELEPLLYREFDEFELTVRKDPENDAVNAPEVPMVWVGLLKTEEDLERDRKAAENAAKQESAKKGQRLKKYRFDKLSAISHIEAVNGKKLASFRTSTAYYNCQPRVIWEFVGENQEWDNPNPGFGGGKICELFFPKRHVVSFRVCVYDETFEFIVREDEEEGK